MEPLLSARIRTKDPTSDSPEIVSFSVIYSPSAESPRDRPEDLSQRMQAKDEELSARLQDVETLKRKLEEMKLEYDALSATHQTLIQSHKDLIRTNIEVHRSLSELEAAHESLQSTHSQIVSDLETANSSLRIDIARLESELQSKEDQVRKLAALMKERDSRKKNAEKLLDQVEKRNKELVEDHVRKEMEIEELKKKCAEYLAELQRFKEDLTHQDGLRKKREEQVQALLAQLKRKEQENARLSRELKRREEENKELSASIQTLAAKVEKETRLKMQKELDQVRGLAAAKEGEMRVVKEMIKSYHHQLKQKEVEVVRFRKKAEVRKPAGRLPPLEGQSSTDQLQSKSSMKSKVSSKDFSQKHRSPKRVSEVDDEKALEELIAQSQQAFQPVQIKSPKPTHLRELVRESREEEKLIVERKDTPEDWERREPPKANLSDEEEFQGDPLEDLAGMRDSQKSEDRKGEDLESSPQREPLDVGLRGSIGSQEGKDYEDYEEDEEIQPQDAEPPTQLQDDDPSYRLNAESEEAGEEPQFDEQRYDDEAMSEDAEMPPPALQAEFDADAGPESP